MRILSVAKSTELFTILYIDYDNSKSTVPLFQSEPTLSNDHVDTLAYLLKLLITNLAVPPQHCI